MQHDAIPVVDAGAPVSDDERVASRGSNAGLFSSHRRFSRIPGVVVMVPGGAASSAPKKLVSRAQFEQAVAQRDALRAQVATAQRNAQVARSSLAIASNGVDNAVVRAPFAGVAR